MNSGLSDYLASAIDAIKSLTEYSDTKPDIKNEDIDEPKTESPIFGKDKTPYGKCIIEIQLKNHGEYLKFAKYFGGRKWEFAHIYPAIMRAEYDFHTEPDVVEIAKQVVRLLQMGFDVYSARWKIADEKSQLEQRL